MNGEDTDSKKNANPSKDWFHMWERLTITVRVHPSSHMFVS